MYAIHSLSYLLAESYPFSLLPAQSTVLYMNHERLVLAAYSRGTWCSTSELLEASVLLLLLLLLLLNCAVAEALHI